MARPMYESKDDLANESQVAEALQKAWKCRLQKLPIKYGADFAAIKDGVVSAWIEVKVRKVKSTDYADSMLSLGKFLQLSRLADETLIPSFLVAKFDDGLFYAKIRYASMGSVVMAGRKDRGDPQDIDPCVHIPINKFRRIA